MRSKVRLSGLPSIGMALIVASVAGCFAERPPVGGGGTCELGETARVGRVGIEMPAFTILFVIDNSGSMCEEQANLRSSRSRRGR